MKAHLALDPIAPIENVGWKKKLFSILNLWNFNIVMTVFNMMKLDNLMVICQALLMDAKVAFMRCISFTQKGTIHK